jgi:ubiquinone/menaquinone biosynthesis C-methylase UbiE
VANHRGWLYDRLIAGMTTGWYREVFSRLAPGTRLLDVGIGTGASLVRCADLVRERELSIVGLDVDADYLARCERALRRAGLDGVQTVLESIYDHDGGPYDAVYFSASLMLLPDPAEAIRRVAALLSPGGTLYATQSFQLRRSRLAERAKPMMRHLTTIEFGRVTYEDEFRACLLAAGVELTELHTMRVTRHLAQRLAVARPATPPPAQGRERNVSTTGASSAASVTRAR